MATEGRSPCPRCGAGLGPGTYFCPRCGTSISQPRGDAVATSSRPSDAARDSLLVALRRAALGDYEILAEVGRGGMATVYLARDLALDRNVAIKVPAPALLAMGEGMVERFKREARTAAALSHPNIIPIYAVKQSPQVLYFVMKYVCGRALDTIIHEVGQVPVPMVQTIIAQVGEALGYAHRHGVIHRDIKSANIMLDDEGIAVVTDFGIAKVVEAEGLTMTGVPIGTPTYMSPEQCATREVTGASDQYSLGVVAYEMLAGRPPFRGDTTMAVMYAHVNENPRPVTELRTDCPPSLAEVVMRMLAKEPLQRWASMDQVVAACGRPSLHHDDPVRSQMMTLAKAGGQWRLLEGVKTPSSPIALARPLRKLAAPMGRARLWWGLGAAVVAVGVWWAASSRETRPTPAMVRDSVAPPAVGPAPATPTPETRTPAPETRGPVPRAIAPRTPPGAALGAAAAESLARVAALERDDSIVRSMRASALSAMRRAEAAGATPTELAQGDTAFRGAESLAAAGRWSEAMVQLATATSLWTDVERRSRARAAEPPRPAAPTTPVPVADPRAGIEQVITDYAAALHSRDVAQVRRAYPGLTSAQEQGWREFFASVRNLRVRLTVTAVTVAGDSAHATVGGLYEYDNATTSRAERRPVTFNATLVAQPGGWRLSAIR